MGWLEPADRKAHERPHQCILPAVGPPLVPGARWQCDECGAIWVWSWVRETGRYQWLVETAYLLEWQKARQARDQPV